MKMLLSILILAHLLASGIAAPLGKTEVLSVPLTDVAQADEGRFVYGFEHPTGRACNSSGTSCIPNSQRESSSLSLDESRGCNDRLQSCGLQRNAKNALALSSNSSKTSGCPCQGFLYCFLEEFLPLPGTERGLEKLYGIMEVDSFKVRVTCLEEGAVVASVVW